MEREGGSARVLIVEDDESAATFVRLVLERAGIDSRWAVTAEQAMSMLSDSRFDVLLTDFCLPGEDGLELVRETRHARPRMGIAVMTGYTGFGIEESARSSGADEFLEKPLTPAALVSQISSLVARSIGVGRAAGIRAETATGSSAASAHPAGRGGGGGGGAGANAAHGRAPVFRRIGSSHRADQIYSAPGLGGPRLALGTSIPLWASVMPAVSHVASEVGCVGASRTSAAWDKVR